jgi:hypothetical protein
MNRYVRSLLAAESRRGLIELERFGSGATDDDVCKSGCARRHGPGGGSPPRPILSQLLVWSRTFQDQQCDERRARAAAWREGAQARGAGAYKMVKPWEEVVEEVIAEAVELGCGTEEGVRERIEEAKTKGWLKGWDKPR